ncbi:hypothetical protein EOM09_09210 [bacterium]|nr:hypothetical protein [bacterium]
MKKDKNLAKEKYLNKYDSKTNQKYDRIFKFSKKYFISSIRKKKDNNYEIIFINSNGFAIFFLFRFLAKKSVHRAIITKIKNHYKIIHLQ